MKSNLLPIRLLLYCRHLKFTDFSSICLRKSEGFPVSFRIFLNGITLFFAIIFGFIAPELPGAESNRILFNFESGDLTQEGWAVVEGECSRPIGSRVSTFHVTSPYPKQGRCYLTTLESAAGPGTYESNICVLESPVFRVTDKQFQFFLGGGNISESWLALCELKPDGSCIELQQFRGKSAQTMEKFVLDLSPHLNKPLFFRLTDKGKGAWSYLHADDFTGTGSVDPKATQLRRDYLKYIAFQQQIDPIVQSVDVLTRWLTDLTEENNKSAEQAVSKLLTQAKSIQSQLKQLRSAPRADLYTRLPELKKQIVQLRKAAAANDPRFTDSSILYISRTVFPYEHHNTETTYQTDDICTHRFPKGSALRIWNAQTDRVHTLLDVPDGIVRDPCVHFDGQKILVSIRWNIEDDFHLYEIDLKKNDPITAVFKRQDLKQLTFGPGLSDIDPQYLPDGRIVFSSSREPKYCMCNRHIMCNLFTMNGDGSNIIQIGHSTLYEGHSSLLPDGRILYYRWEYVDRNFSDAQGVWVTNPDGTNHSLFWGNNTESPATTVNPQIIPGSSSLFVCTMTACHTPAWGAIGLIDRSKGLDGKEPILQVWPQDAWNLIGTYTGTSYDNLARLSQFFEDPWPLDDRYILAAGTIPNGTLLPTEDGSKSESPMGETGLWLLDRQGGMQLLHIDPIGCFDPVPLAPSEAPPVIIDRTDLAKDKGNFYITNVYEGFGMKDVAPDSIKYLRVIESPEKRFWIHPSWVGVDGKGNQQAPAMSWNDFGSKKILGTVPVEKDGSVYFSVPADKFVFFQLLDEKRQMIQSMRSGVIVRPGETNGCYGCHEDRLATPVSNRLTTAMQKPPRELQPEFNRPPFTFSYTNTVQPILDRYCVACHDRPTEKSSDLAKRAAKKILLCGDRNTVFNRSYWELQDKKIINVIGGAYAAKIKPLAWGAHNSKLIDIMRKGHDNGGAIDRARTDLKLLPIKQIDLDMTIAWIDMNAPYYAEYSSNYPTHPYGRSPITQQEMQELAKLTGWNLIQHKMAFGLRPDPMLDFGISFDRPELSPCLDKWNSPEAKKTPEYQRALAIIRTGHDRLQTVPRADMPKWKIVNPTELKREKKYEVFLKRSQNMKEAILRGEKLFDRDNQLPFEKCL